jgi:hypothetical protein
LLASLEPAADDALGAALGLGLGRNGIKLGGVEEIDAAINGIIHLGVALGLGVLLTIGHGSEADEAHIESCPAKLAILHDDFSPA